MNNKKKSLLPPILIGVRRVNKNLNAMTKTFIIILLMLASKGLLAQDITSATISWAVISTQAVNTGEITETGDRVVSHGANTIEWTDRRGVVKKSFTISEVNGSWTNVQSPGTILYEVQSGEESGTITFQRTMSDILIRILILRGEEVPDIYEMTISTITVQ